MRSSTLALCVGLVACTSGAARQSLDADGVAGDAAVALDQGAHTDGDPVVDAAGGGLPRFVGALCRFLERIQADEGRVIESVERCVAQWTASASCDDQLRAAQASTFEACAAWLDEASSYDDLGGALAPSCALLLTVQDEGQNCWRDIGPVVPYGGCKSGLICINEPYDALCDTCRRRGQVGDRCTSGVVVTPGSTPCAAGLTCIDSECAVRPDNEGDECAASFDCKTGWCKGAVYEGNVLLEPGKCAKRVVVAPGQPCGADDLCQGHFRRCHDGACTERRLPGQSCATDDDCLPSRAEAPHGRRFDLGFYRCDEGICRALTPCQPRKEGELCTMTGDCAAGLHCTCAKPPCIAGRSPLHCFKDKPVGAACTNRDCGPAGYCSEDGKCAKAPLAGEACSHPIPCGSSDYCDPWGMPCARCNGRICVELKVDGELCTFASECRGGWCNEQTNKCEQACPLRR